MRCRLTEDEVDAFADISVRARRGRYHLALADSELYTNNPIAFDRLWRRSYGSLEQRKPEMDGLSQAVNNATRPDAQACATWSSRWVRCCDAVTAQNHNSRYNMLPIVQRTVCLHFQCSRGEMVYWFCRIHYSASQSTGLHDIRN